MADCFRSVILAGCFVPPHLTNETPENEILCEWWNGTRKLSAYFGIDSLTLLKITGPNIETDMVEIENAIETDFVDALRWVFEC